MAKSGTRSRFRHVIVCTFNAGFVGKQAVYTDSVENLPEKVSGLALIFSFETLRQKGFRFRKIRSAFPPEFADKNGHPPSAWKSTGVYMAKNMSDIF